MTTLQEWLAECIEQTANWRRGVSERYPDDVRNRHSADALDALSASIRRLPDQHAGLTKLRALGAVAEDDVEVFIATPEELSRFGFDWSPHINAAGDVAAGADDILRVCDLFYRASLDSWQQARAEDPDAFADRPALIELLDTELGPPGHDDDEEGDAIESVHARIDRLERRVARLERRPG